MEVRNDIKAPLKRCGAGSRALCLAVMAGDHVPASYRLDLVSRLFRLRSMTTD